MRFYEGPHPRPLSRPGEGRYELDQLSPSTPARLVVQGAARDLRKAPTKSEALLWVALRNRKLARRKFRRQHPVGRFVIDFYCAEDNLAVEVDGGVHESRQVADMERQRILEAEGIRYIRLPAQLVEDDIDLARQIIADAFTAVPSPVRRERDDSLLANRGEG